MIVCIGYKTYNSTLALQATTKENKIVVDQRNRESIYALKVHQWLPSWNEIHWNSEENQGEPQHWFYQFSMPASSLRRLSGVYARSKDRKSSSEDLGIQRQHNVERSQEIGRFVEFGYPWSDLRETKRKTADFFDLRKPGWLPTAVVVNILVAGDERIGKKLAESDVVEIEDNDNGYAQLLLPKGFNNEDWTPDGLAPVEVIDGQHRLWAFEEIDKLKTYELPVVAFVGLDLSWQAYLFYTINIKPKKINTSLAFDLYPLLRTEQWLEKFEGHSIYREARSQELVDKLWSHSESPWHHRINMLGETGYKGLMVSQAAWVRSLRVSFVKNWEGPNVQIGGIFGAKVGSHNTILPWSLSEQAAFLIFMGKKVQEAIANTKAVWAESLRKQDTNHEPDAAFFGQNNLLNQDQGIRVLLQVINDLFFINADKLRLYVWGGDFGREDNDTDTYLISKAIQSLSSNEKISNFLDELAGTLAKFDWRASSFPGLTEDQRILKASFRGSGGYKELRRHLLQHIKAEHSDVAITAKTIMDKLGYSE